MFRLRSNWSTRLVEPRVLVDVISVTPAINPKWRSSGAATDEAMVSGSAPGRFADTWMVGNSTWGSGATGSKRKAIAPASANPTVRSVVATGLLMKWAEMFMTSSFGDQCRSYRQTDHHASVAPTGRGRDR